MGGSHHAQKASGNGRVRADETFRVLLIEDDAGYARALERTLGRSAAPSFDLEWVDRLAVGLDRLECGVYDVVLLDLLLPDGAGLDTLARLRELERGVPIVVLTAMEDETSGIEAVRRGAQDYLFKSEVGGHSLVRALCYAIERVRAERRLAVQARVTQCLAEAATLEEAGPEILRAIGEGLRWDVGVLWCVDRVAGRLRCVASWHGPGAEAGEFVAACHDLTFAPDCGLPGRIWALGLPVEVGNVLEDPRFLRTAAADRSGLRGAIGFPILRGADVLAVLEFLGREVRPLDDAMLRAMAALGSQVGQFIERQRALRDSAARKAAIFESAPDAIVTMDHLGTIVEFNPAAERTFGYPRAEAIGRTMAELLVPPGLREAHRQGLARYLETGEPVILGRWIETRGIRRGGEEFAADLAITPIATDGPPLFSGFVRDVTGRESAQQEVLRATFLAAMAAKAGLALIQDDPLPTILGGCAEVIVRYLEIPLVRIWAVDGESLVRVACRWMDPAQPDTTCRIPVERISLDPAGRSSRRARAGAVTDDAADWARRERADAITTHPLVVGDRLVGLLELFAHRPPTEPAFDALGPVLDGIAQCIERKRSEDRLRASETRLRFLIDRMPGILWTTDLQLRFTTSTGTDRAGMDAGLGRSPTPMTLPEFFRTDDPDFLPIAAHRRALGGETVGYEMEWAGRIFQSHVEPLHDGRGCLIGCIGVALDVTRLRGVERSLRRTEEEFRIAGEIQNVLYPKTAPAPRGYDIHGSSNPAQAAGGDYFDFVPLADGRIGIGIGDVSGHGLGPALLMASTRAYLRAIAATHADAGQILAKLNRALAHDVGDERFVTLCLVLLDPKDRTLVYANAGHPHGYVLDHNGEIRSILESMTPPLGVIPDCEFPAGVALTLNPGDLVLLMTDGILEAFDPEGMPFGIARVLEVARAHRTEPAHAIVEAVLRAALHCTRGDPPIDDLTAIVIKYNGDEQAGRHLADRRTSGEPRRAEDRRTIPGHHPGS